MKLSLSWLNEYVEISDLSVRELADKLTFSGVEVESIDVIGAALDDHFVVAEVITTQPHPNADKLTLCSVNDGTTTCQVVCGAPNVRAGLKVALARIGAVIPEGGFKIKQAKLRGEVSQGMLCSARELQLGADHTGIMELDASALVGSPLRELLPPPETVLDLEITWNRPDCLSIIGMARELAALLGRPLKMPALDFACAGPPVAELAAVRLEAPDLCPRYTARVLTDVQDGPAPAWMQRRLELCGVRPLGLIVDVTNYVMLECGQPLHAFDHTRLTDNTVVVRRACSGEKLTTLDEVERQLDPAMLVIADAIKPVAIAGVMGGAGSEIAPDTTTVLIESALFDAPAVKATATRLGLRTESSHRFERGVDPELADWASRRAAALLARYGKACVAPGLIDVDQRAAPPPPVTLRYRRTREVIGLELPVATIDAHLTSLGLVREEADDATASYRIPSWRLDLTCEADLIEEVARLHGLDQLPDLAPAAVAVAGRSDLPVRAAALIRQTLLGFGFSEAMHYSFLSAGELDTFTPDLAQRRLLLPNPVSADYGVMRDSLLPQLAQTLGRNVARQIEAPALFELGRVFERRADGSIKEEQRLALGFAGPFGRGSLERRAAVTREESLLWLKGVLEALAARLHLAAPTLQLGDYSPFETGWSAEIMLGRQAIGRLGLINATIRHAWRVNQPLALAELAFEPLLAQLDKRRPVAAPPPYPSVHRDLALVVPPHLTHGEIEAVMREAAPRELTEISLFDIFTLKESENCCRSMAYSLAFRSDERTLTDDEVNAACHKIMAALKTKLGVEVRAG